LPPGRRAESGEKKHKTIGRKRPWPRPKHAARPGHWDGREDARLAGLEKARGVAVKVRQAKAAEAYTDLLPSVTALKAEGLSLRAIAERLNADGHTTRRGRPWNPVQVSRVLEHAEAARV
jgi:Recombinase